MAQAAGVQRQHHGVDRHRLPPGAHPVPPAARGLDALHLGAGAQLHAEPGEVGGQRVPERLRVGLVGDVEEEALGGAEEVDVEHQRQLGGGEFGRVDEEAPGEHLERQVPGPLGEPHPVQEVGGADPVQPGVHLRHPYVQERQRGRRVQPRQFPHAEARAERGEAEGAQWRGARHVAEAVAGAVAAEEG